MMNLKDKPGSVSLWTDIFHPLGMSYQVTGFHLISFTFQPLGILVRPGPNIHAANDLAQLALQNNQESSDASSVPFNRYRTFGSRIVNLRLARL